MSKPYTTDNFSSQITEDRNWRIKEISDLQTAIRRADTTLQQVLLRALVAICYAHWEGYVNFCARKYLQHIALKSFRFKELDRQFSLNYFLPRLASLSKSKASVAERCAIVSDILTSSDHQFSKVNYDLINTKSNLKFDVFVDICLVCGVPTQLFKDERSFIDNILVKRRNAIAHGEPTFVAVEDMNETADGTIGIMRAFGDALENQIVLGTYRGS